MSCVTIKYLAKRLGISPSTVSRSLRDHPGISRATKEKVAALAAQCNYQPNLVAQSLQTRKTNTIGVIVPEIRHDFFSSAISGIEQVAHEAGFTIMVSQTREIYEREVMNTRTMVSHRVAGLILSLSRETILFDHLKMVIKQGIPVVLFDRVTDEILASTVVVDDFEGARTAVEHLIRRGYRRIAHLAGPPYVSISRNRLAGYRCALEEKSLPFDPKLVVPGGFQEKDGRAGMATLMSLPEPPDAIFAVNDPVAIGVFTWMKEAGLKIPENMALVGFSNNPITALIAPPLTTVEQPALDLGRTAARLLLEQMKRDGTLPFVPVMKVLKTRLIVRKST